VSKKKDPAYEFLDGVRQDFDDDRSVTTPSLNGCLEVIEEEIEAIKIDALRAYPRKRKGTEEEIVQRFRRIATVCMNAPYVMKMK
jgi:putative N-acetylmannosamine-6-phosphate epimerase